MPSVKPAPGPLTVYVDQACAMCVGAAQIATRHDRAGRLRITDLASAGRRSPAQELHRALHVVDAAGTVFRGYDALVAIVVSTPGGRWVGPLLRRAPMRWIGGRVYARVARKRDRVTPVSGS